MVNLSSVHQAKGLEWKVVFVIWMADGMFPFLALAGKRRRHRRGAPSFLRRRHPRKDELYLTYPLLRLNAGYGEMLQRPSRFLNELPKELLEEWQISGAF